MFRVVEFEEKAKNFNAIYKTFSNTRTNYAKKSLIKFFSKFYLTIEILS